jgi:malate dehydrogenase
MTRVAIVGAGMVGATTAARIAEARLCDHVALIDVAGDLARAMALDIGSSLPLLGSDTLLTGGESYDQARGADVVVITAGRPRQPGQSRADLLEGNGRIVVDVCREVRTAAPDAVVIVVTNPLDEMTTLAQDALGFPPERVVGMAGLLDTARFRHFLAEHARVPVSSVDALTLGSHGDTMVPLSRTATIGSRPAGEVLGAGALDEVAQRTRDGGAEVVRLLQRGSAYWAPSAAVMLMVRAILLDEQVVLPLAARLSGQFGIDGVYVGVPARLGRRGVSEIVTTRVDAMDVAGLRAAAAEVERRVGNLRQLGFISPRAAAPHTAGGVPPPPALFALVRETLLQEFKAGDT